MRISECIQCVNFPCVDVDHRSYRIPPVDLEPHKIHIMLISESAASDEADDYYANGQPLFAQTTLLAFGDAGAPVGSIQDLLELGIYMTPAVKCAKTTYGIRTGTVLECSYLLEQELELFPNLQAFLLMGDVAIKSLNAIAKRTGASRVIPAGSTYKIRGGEFYFRGVRAFPSYLQAGPSFFIEKSKRRAIAEDITAALQLLI